VARVTKLQADAPVPQGKRRRHGPSLKKLRKAIREIKADATRGSNPPNNSGSENTRKSEQSAVRYWTAWHALRYPGQTFRLPVPADVIESFIVDHSAAQSTPAAPRSCRMPPEVERQLVAQGFKKPGVPSVATVLQRVYMIARVNRPHLAGRPNPATALSVRRSLSALRRSAEAARNSRRRSPPMTADILARLLELERPDKADLRRYRLAIRDRALVLFGFAAGGRRSDISAVLVTHFERNANSDYTYLPPAKAGERQTRWPLTGATALAISDWLSEAEISSGPLFRKVSASGAICASGISPETVRNVVVRLCKEAGLADRYSAHSLRSGFIIDALLTNGVSLSDAMAVSGRRTLQPAIGQAAKARRSATIRSH
jgi:integrase